MTQNRRRSGLIRKEKYRNDSFTTDMEIENAMILMYATNVWLLMDHKYAQRTSDVTTEVQSVYSIS